MRRLILAAPLLLAGLFPLDDPLAARWGVAGAWLIPVGDPHRLGAPGQNGVPGYNLNRGLSPHGDQGAGHDGDDLANGRSGDRVRAAANGLVVRVSGAGEFGGYGSHVVIAHRLPNGQLVYSVYAHLTPGSECVHAGQLIRAGDPIGRVGESGRATTPHLHFEVRSPDDPTLRWEKAAVQDPMAFVSARLPMGRAKRGWADPYLEWAACAALLDSTDDPDQPLTRARWWRMLARAARPPILIPPQDDERLRGALVEARLLPEKRTGHADEWLEWPELSRDLERLETTGSCLPPGPLARARHRALCRMWLGSEHPARHAAHLGATVAGHPSAADACVLLADLAGPAPKPAARRRAPTGLSTTVHGV